MKNTIAFTLFYLIFFTLVTFAQDTPVTTPELLTNESIIKMSKAGLSKELILKKVSASPGRYDLSVESLLALKNAGVEDSVIVAMMAVKPPPMLKTKPPDPNAAPAGNTSQSQYDYHDAIKDSRDMLRAAKTVSFKKNSVQPSLQALEKELLKRADWQALNLTLIHPQDESDLYIEISYVHLSWITHRYVFNVYDLKSGAIIAAGETTSWGSLAENMAREISKKLTAVLVKR